MIYYIHGYLSNPNSEKGKLFKYQLNVINIKYRNCKPQDMKISNCLDLISNEIKIDKNVILIGSSFGGYLSLKITQKYKNVKILILLNPSIIPPDENIDNIKDMPKRILEEMKKNDFFRVNIKTKIFIIIGTEDKIVPNSWSIKFAEIQNANVLLLKDDHRLSKNLEYLPKLINQIIKQNN